jgi:hypothetical protein
MNNIKQEGNRRTPTIEFNYEEGIIKISGRSIPENTWSFYKPLLDWVTAYTLNPPSLKTQIEIKLEYCNSSSGKFLLDLLKILDDFASSAHQTVSFKWFYAQNDEDMEEIGEDLASFLKNMQTELVVFKRDAPVV